MEGIYFTLFDYQTAVAIYMQVYYVHSTYFCHPIEFSYYINS